MRQAKIFHNPSAGKQEHSKKKLVSLVKSKGIECGYSSTKKVRWKKIKPDTDFLVIAGGDGTVRQVALKLLTKKRLKNRLPILLLPLGTANNIAKSLGIEGHLEEILKNIDRKRTKKFDVGKVEGLKKEIIFLESFGYGVFPELIKRMNEKPEQENATREEKLKSALEHLHSIIINYPAKPFTISVGGIEHTDNYILAEVMNISSIGPNLILSPDSDPGDGQFELVLVSEYQRDEFASYVSYKISGIEKSFKPISLKGTKFSISTGPCDVHFDDELMTIKKAKKVKVIPDPGVMEFFVQ